VSKLNYLLTTMAVVSAMAPFLVNCSSAEGDSTSEDVTASAEYIDCNEIAGIPGRLPRDKRLSELENIGRCAWVLGTGRTSDNPKFAAKGKDGKPVPGGLGGTEYMLTNIGKKNGTVVPLGLVLSAKNEAERVERWKKFGTMNDPDCRAASKTDEYGLQMDECKDEFSAGVVGFRKFKNPAFDKSKWDVSKYSTEKDMEPPYLIGITCGGCHTSFDPLHPAADVAHPKWENLIYTIGNQYLSEGEIFKASTPGSNDFRWHVLDTQERGTSDTSRISSDHINNPNAINPIFNLAFRPYHNEALKAGQVTFDLTNVDINALNKMSFEQASKALTPIRVESDGEQHPVQSILKGGEDSVGPVGALLRVFVNVGMCSDVWLQHFDPVVGKGEQTPIRVEELYEQCPSYQDMLGKVPALFLFLAKQGPLYLRDAPGGKSFVDESLVEKGAIAFANNCATCHSSKQPPEGTADRNAWFRQEIMKADFLKNNFLSDDKSYPVTEVGTNAARALHTNHMKGHIWSDAYASQSYDERKFPGKISVKNPYAKEAEHETFEFQGPDGGPGYYRTPTLISIWARAPFLHNKALGTYTGDPSVKGRLTAYEDAATKLLSPDKRGSGFIKVTATDSILDLQILGLKVNIAKGTPVNLFANLDPNKLFVKTNLLEFAVLGKLGIENPFDPYAFSLLHGTDGKHLLDLGECPDIVEDRGHTYGSALSDTDKKALIEYMKTL